MNLRRGIAVVAVALLAGCGGSGAGRVTQLTASGAWARPTPPGASNGVVYLELRTDRDDALVGAQVEPAVAASASLHRTDGGGGGAPHHGGDGVSGTLTMRPVESFPLVPDEPLVFEPGGNHVMLEGLATPLVAGGRFRLDLTFASGRTLPVTVDVTANAPAGGGGGGGH